MIAPPFLLRSPRTIIPCVREFLFVFVSLLTPQNSCHRDRGLPPRGHPRRHQRKPRGMRNAYRQA